MPVVFVKNQTGTRGKVGTTGDFQGFSAIEIHEISALQIQAELKSAKPGLSCGSRAIFEQLACQYCSVNRLR
jgi:hypothetical protein